MPATGDGHPGGSRDPLGVPEPPVRRACAVLHLSGDRVFRRRGVRGRRRMVEAGLHAAPPVGPETAPFLSFRYTGHRSSRCNERFRYSPLTATNRACSFRKGDPWPKNTTNPQRRECCAGRGGGAGGGGAGGG